MLNFTREPEEVIEHEPNFTAVIDGSSLILTIDLSKDQYPTTKSGKKLLIASSHGFHNVEETTISLSLNVTADLPKAE